jgi:hypothetical protein
MACEILKAIRKKHHNFKLTCNEECLVEHVCPYTDDDLAFPTREIDNNLKGFYMEEIPEKVSQ